MSYIVFRIVSVELRMENFAIYDLLFTIDYFSVASVLSVAIFIDYLLFTIDYFYPRNQRNPRFMKLIIDEL